MILWTFDDVNFVPANVFPRNTSFDIYSYQTWWSLKMFGNPTKAFPRMWGNSKDQSTSNSFLPYKVYQNVKCCWTHIGWFWFTYSDWLCTNAKNSRVYIARMEQQVSRKKSFLDIGGEFHFLYLRSIHATWINYSSIIFVWRVFCLNVVRKSFSLFHLAWMPSSV